MTDWDTEHYEELSQVLKAASDKLKRDFRTKDELEKAIEDFDDWGFYEFKVVRWLYARRLGVKSDTLIRCRSFFHVASMLVSKI